ncbi:MAG: TolB family protein, partial [Vicinamibacterales bacterium]
MRVDITTPSTEIPFQFALSPDGRQIVFVVRGGGATRLWLRPLDKTEAMTITGTDGAFYPFWSPDSRSVGFFASGKLRRIDVAGGPTQDLADAPSGRGGAWNADGTIVFAPTSSGPLMRVTASGGEPAAITTLKVP